MLPRRHSSSFTRSLASSASAALTLAGFLLLPLSASAVDEHVGACMQTASGLPDLNCTANDLGIGELTVTSGDGACKANPAGNWDIAGVLGIGPDTTQRYDLGFYIGSDGEQALTGTCWRDVIEDPAIEPDEDPSDTFINLDGDACGDHGDQSLQLTIHDVTVKCSDADQNGYLDVPLCVSYDNNAGGVCNGPADAVPANDAKCQCLTVNTNVRSRCLTNADCDSDGNVCTDEVCHPTPGSGGDGYGCSHDDNQASCDDGLFCNGDDVCAAGACTHSGDPCVDGVDCTVDSCVETSDDCVFDPDDSLCDDEEACTTDVCDPDKGCLSDWVCKSDICRSAGYWANHSGNEKTGSINVAQDLMDLVGGLEVCGQSIDATVNASSPWMKGLGLESDLQGLCMRSRGVKQRQLYRQLVAAAFNCAVSGAADDCDSVVRKYVDVLFSDCSEVCSGSAAAGAPSMARCTSQLDCFNNGGRIVGERCALGTCATETTRYCGADTGECPWIENQPQACVPFPGNCHASPLCNEDIAFCPKNTPASSVKACREAKFDGCTIDSCSD